jgi:hypothetical protein
MKERNYYSLTIYYKFIRSDVFAKRFTALEHAVVYFKPRHFSAAAASLLDEIFQNFGIKVIHRAVIAGTEVSYKRMFDRQYPELVKYSTEIPAMHITLTEEETELFEGTFHRSWQDVKSNLVPKHSYDRDNSSLNRPPSAMKKSAIETILFNAEEALKHFHIDGDTLCELSDAENALTVKLRRGLYCTRINHDCTKIARIKALLHEPIYVINPFFHSLKHNYTTAPNAAINICIIEWDVNSLTWPSLLSEVIGDREPTKASLNSFRFRASRDWNTLGFRECPNVYKNGLHVSQSAIEGLHERLIWKRNAMVFTDLFGSRLMTSRFTSAQINAWLANPEVGKSSYAGNSNCRLFEVLRGKSSDECISSLMLKKY